MRLLLDQNLSPHLVQALADLFPGSAHVREVGLSQATDDAVWTYAAGQGYYIARGIHTRMAPGSRFAQA